MQKILACSLVLLSTLAFGQTEKKSVYAGGGFALRTGEGSSQFSLNPTIGYFFADNFALGGTVSYDGQKLGAVTNNSFGIGPFARYYFGKTATKPFAVTEFDFLSTTAKQANASTIKTNGTRFLIGLGFAAFINETVAVEGITGYSYANFKDADGSGGFVLRLGFGLYFNKNSAKTLKTNVIGE